MSIIQLSSGDWGRRRLLCEDVGVFLQKAVAQVNAGWRQRGAWRLEIGADILFDAAGLQHIMQALQQYQGQAQRLQLQLTLSREAQRDYYSHNIHLQQGKVLLPMQASRTQGEDRCETLELSLPELQTAIAFPQALTAPDQSHIPLALLLPFSCAHDFLFANQIAAIAHIAREIRRQPWRCWRALFARRAGNLRQRLPLFWKRIHPSARVHPTAVIEGAQIGPGCRIGAHCVVRFSVLGQHVHLHDGAKVEYSVVDDHSWLMHDLVLYRCLVESQAFLIHGPYQFSYFQHQSSAFATIMMDYRPDNRPIQINTPHGVRPYLGRFLGALLEEESKVLGGSLTAPGITIPRARQISVKPEDVVKAKDLLAS